MGLRRFPDLTSRVRADRSIDPVAEVQSAIWTRTRQPLVPARRGVGGGRLDHRSSANRTAPTMRVGREIGAVGVPRVGRRAAGSVHGEKLLQGEGTRGPPGVRDLRRGRGGGACGAPPSVRGQRLALCAAHRAPSFVTRRAGRDLEASLLHVWRSAGCLTASRSRALSLHRARLAAGCAGRKGPGLLLVAGIAAGGRGGLRGGRASGRRHPSPARARGGRGRAVRRACGPCGAGSARGAGSATLLPRGARRPPGRRVRRRAVSRR